MLALASAFNEALVWAAANPALATVAAVVTVAASLQVVAALLRGSNGYSHTQSLFDLNSRVSSSKERSSGYTKTHTVGGGNLDERLKDTFNMVNDYYDLSTDFYMFGWGQSFHFATRYPEETLPESIRRHEYSLANRMQLEAGDRVLDVGCGVGGPARNISRFADVSVVGLNNNDYQVKRGNAIAAAEGVADKVQLVKGNFMDIDMPEESFDGAYAIEATCHAPDRTKCFSEVFKVLKPGATFAGYEWVFTDKYDASNPEHKKIMDGIELGNGLPTTTPASDVVDALTAAGFEVKSCVDLAPTSQVPWYQPFVPEYTVQGFKTTPVGILLTNLAVSAMELVGLAPKGTAEMHTNLSTGASTLYEAGQLGIFTPMLQFVAVKPGAKGQAGRKSRSRSRAE